MKLKTLEEFPIETKKLEKQYENHFGVAYPDRIIGFWDPLNITLEEANIGYEEMAKAVNEAIAKNEPFKELSPELWDSIVF